jgi:hypothetical protein
MHIRLSDRHAGKAAEAPVVPDRGFSAATSRAPGDNLLLKTFSIKIHDRTRSKCTGGRFPGFGYGSKPRSNPVESLRGFDRRARSEKA